MNYIKQLIQSFKPRSKEDLDQEYLNQATSLYDLEWRQKQLDREESNKGRNFPYHNSR